MSQTPPQVNLTAMARVVTQAWDDYVRATQDAIVEPDDAHKVAPYLRRFGIVLEAWEALTGMDEGSLALARSMSEAVPPVMAAVAPF